MAVTFKEQKRDLRGWAKQRSNKARAPLRKDQCAFCKEDGHWKNEFPKRKQKEHRSEPVPILVEEGD